MKTCIKCEEQKPDPEFYAKNKTGWSKYCTACRKRRQQKVVKQRARKLHKLKHLAEVEVAAIAEEALKRKIDLLQKEFKRFTLVNRNRLQVILKKTEGKADISERTLKAVERRTLDQERAEALLKYQIQVVQSGLRTQHISKLWRDRYGPNTGIESQSAD